MAKADFVGELPCERLTNSDEFSGEQNFGESAVGVTMKLK
jgi:hypothetical protein